MVLSGSVAPKFPRCPAVLRFPHAANAAGGVAGMKVAANSLGTQGYFNGR